MASLPPNPTIQEIEDEFLFQQTLLETLDDDDGSNERRAEIKSAISELEELMARANDGSGVGSQSDSQRSYKAPGAYPQDKDDDDHHFPQVDGNGDLPNPTPSSAMKRSHNQMSPGASFNQTPSKRPSMSTGPPSQTSVSQDRRGAWMERQKELEEHARRRREAEARDAAYASHHSRQPASSSAAGPSRSNPYAAANMSPTKMAPVFRARSQRPPPPEPSQSYGRPAVSHTTPRVKHEGHGQSSALHPPQRIEAGQQQARAPALVRRPGVATVIDLTGDDDDEETPRVAAPQQQPLAMNNEQWQQTIQHFKVKAEEELRRQGQADHPQAAAMVHNDIQRRVNIEYQRQQHLMRIQQAQQQAARLQQYQQQHPRQMQPNPIPGYPPAYMQHHAPSPVPNYLRSQPVPSQRDLHKMDGIMNGRGRGAYPTFDVDDDDDSDDALQYIRSEARHVDSPGWDIMDSETTKEELRKLMENIQPDDLNKIANEDDVAIDALNIKLKPYQNAGLEWLQKMEDGSNKGGILADDMGLGKTVQAISLLVTRRSEDAVDKTTLILAPVALLRQWEQEILTKVKPGRHRLHVFVHHSGSKKKTHRALRDFDVVLTTFGTIAAELKKIDRYELRKKADPLAQPRDDEKCLFIGPDCKWYRIIIDEAQCIKNRTTKTARAAFCINARSRFCMTGTPMMNSIEELYSLIHFIRIKPYNNWQKFRSDFVTPLRSTDERMREAAMHKLQALLKAVLLRRNKKTQIGGRPILNLPERRVEETNPAFSVDEQALYTAIETKSALTFNKYLKAGTVNKSYAQILVLLLRLRQACCHPHLIKDLGVVAATAEISQDTMDDICRNLDPAVIKRIKEADGNFECPVCYDAVENPAIFTPCGHDTCPDCFTRLADPSNAVADGEEARTTKCPECRGQINTKQVLDYECFKRIHMPELADPDASGNVKGELVDGEMDADSDTDSEEDDEDDDTDSLDGFIVNDEIEDDEAANGDEDAAERKQKAKLKGKGKGKAKLSKKAKGKRKSTEKSEKKKKAATMTVPELKKLASRSTYWRKMYLKTIKKGFIPSAKIEQTIDILEPIMDSVENEKVIIFSQWTSLLDLLEVPISDKGWGYRRYDGSMNAKLRADAVDDFKARPNVRMMLVSLKAGNAGLNLSCASQVIILDPFWNPYIEEQAIDRSHRLGQTRPVMVHRVLVKETVEDRIVALQEKKRALISEALDEKASQSLGRLSVQELAYLFGINRTADGPVGRRGPAPRQGAAGGLGA